MTLDGRQSVMVLGAGPAGLTAAYRLALGGLRVTVLTPSARIGEHVRRESDPPASILGCHEATWALLHALGIRPDQPAFAEAQLEFLLPSGRVVRYPKTRFPTPIQQLLTIGRFSGLRAGERWKLLSWLEQLWEGSVELPADLVVVLIQRVAAVARGIRPDSASGFGFPPSITARCPLLA